MVRIYFSQSLSSVPSPASCRCSAFFSKLISRAAFFQEEKAKEFLGNMTGLCLVLTAEVRCRGHPQPLLHWPWPSTLFACSRSASQRGNTISSFRVGSEIAALIIYFPASSHWRQRVQEQMVLQSQGLVSSGLLQPRKESQR